MIANPPTFTRDQYSTFFLTFVDDVNGDGRPDVIAIGDAGGGNGSGTPNAFWYQNPGPSEPRVRRGRRRRSIGGLVANESPVYVDLLGDAKRELVFMTDQQLGYARPASDRDGRVDVHGRQRQHDFDTPYVHGLGVGDIDGDGLRRSRRAHRLVAPGRSGATWERHAFDFWSGMHSGRASNWGGAQMQVFDVDGDGDDDVVTALAAHRYGLSWFEHTGTGACDDVRAARDPARPPPATDNVSQLHALVVADVNGDGLPDVVAGKRYYAHPSTNADPGTTDPAVLSWFELQRSARAAPRSCRTSSTATAAPAATSSRAT